jgi:predicted ArsR family transcriptional regulator
MDDARLDAVAAPELRRTLLCVREQPRPVTADDVAVQERVHRNVARARLERLVAAGLLVTSFQRRSGRAGPGAGRPAKLYATAPELEAIEFPRRRLGDLVALLIAGQPRRKLREAGRAFGRLLAAESGVGASRTSGVERLRETVGRLGFQVSVVETGPERVVLSTPTCPLRPLVAAHPEATEVDAAMWAGLVEGAFGGVRAQDVRCETAGCFDGRGPCRVTLRVSKNHELV